VDGTRWMGGRERDARARGGDGTDETRGEALAKERGIVVKIASFGSYDVIQAYCDLALGDGVMTREDISTPSVVGSRDGCSVEGGKNKQLQKICEEMYGIDAWKERVDTVVLFDDDERNVAAAIASGFRAVHTPDGFDARAARIIFPNDF